MCRAYNCHLDLPSNRCRSIARAAQSVRFVFAFGIGAALAQDADRTELRLLALFGDVFELVRGQYVDPVPDKKLIGNAVNDC